MEKIKLNSTNEGSMRRTLKPGFILSKTCVLLFVMLNLFVLLFVIVAVNSLPKSAPLHEDTAAYLQPLKPNPYIRSTNKFYEKYASTSKTTTPTTNQLKEYPSIYKDKGNVFKPKPLQPGPWVPMTKGEIWPKPKFQLTNSTFLVLDVSQFRIHVSTIKLT